MAMLNVDNWQQRTQGLSRRHFLGGVGIGCVYLVSRVWSAGGDDNPLPPPRFVLQWGSRGKGEGEFSACVGIAISKNDEVYTAEFRNERVQKFTTEGKFLGTFAIQPHAGGLAVDG